MIASVRLEKRRQGSAIVETPGALLLLFFFILFPLLDLLSLAGKYAACYTLHQTLLREASLIPASLARSDEGPIKHLIPEQWSGSGLGAFADLSEKPSTELRYTDAEFAANGVRDHYVVVESSFRVKPFLTADLPCFPDIPGLNRPFAFNFEGQRLLENPDNIKK